jgi:hypothetical protein
MRAFAWLLLLASCASVPKPPPDAAEGKGPPPVCDADDDERLVVDWSPMDRSKLEAAARHGIVPVRIDGCRARVVDTCTVMRTYAFAATSRQREVMVVRDRDELGAKLPILATRLGASFSQSEAVDVAMTVVGRYEAGPRPITQTDLVGEGCGGVTHVVANMSVGAFSIATARATNIEGSIDVVHAARAREKKRLDSAGLEEQCALARRSDDAPPEDCAIPLRLELRTLSEKPRPPAASEPAPIAEVDMKHAMENAKKQLVPCHRAARATSPNLSGVLTLGVRLAKSGHVRSVSAKHTGNLDDDLAECAAQRVAMVMFPPGEDDKPRSVVIPVMFAPIAR